MGQLISCAKVKLSQLMFSKLVLISVISPVLSHYQCYKQCLHPMPGEVFGHRWLRSYCFFLFINSEVYSLNSFKMIGNFI